MASFLSHDGTEMYSYSSIGNENDQVTIAEIDGVLCTFPPTHFQSIFTIFVYLMIVCFSCFSQHTCRWCICREKTERISRHEGNILPFPLDYCRSIFDCFLTDRFDIKKLNCFASVCDSSYCCMHSFSFFFQVLVHYAEARVCRHLLFFRTEFSSCVSA